MGGSWGSEYSTFMRMSSSFDDISVGERLFQVRRRHRLSQQAFAQSLGVGARTYQNYERGDRPVNKELLLALYEQFHCDPTWVLTGKYPSLNAAALSRIFETMADEEREDQAHDGRGPRD